MSKSDSGQNFERKYFAPDFANSETKVRKRTSDSKILSPLLCSWCFEKVTGNTTLKH